MSFLTFLTRRGQAWSVSRGMANGKPNFFLTNFRNSAAITAAAFFRQIFGENCGGSGIRIFGAAARKSE